jgi:hypothetical protein
MPKHDTLTSTPVDGSDEEILERALACRSPDREVPVEELTWWVALQERFETRAELAAAGLL